uniref:CARD domain-containing protein n=1 Tax=Neogobius melanostomus TaxID=47308 RepID=A0A8C6SQP3_9GOBI
MFYKKETKRDINKHRPEKARYVVDTVIRKGPKAASSLIKEYCELDPCSELCDKLKL